jgi:hypothetical protein
MISEQVELNELIANPAARRLWLLHRALQHRPFGEAIELACNAEAFITGSPANEYLSGARVDERASQVSERPAQPSEQISSDGSERPTVTKRTRLELSAEHRERLLDRLAQGAKNIELAAEFGVSSKQVQGLRMGCAREIAQRRDQLRKKPVHPDQTPAQSASVEDIVRYLRQQDDVVVLQEDGSYLINGRFRMPVAELIVRANRMRSRQGKPVFELPGRTPARRGKISSANGHPLFWKESARSERVRNGFDEPETRPVEGA